MADAPFAVTASWILMLGVSPTTIRSESACPSARAWTNHVEPAGRLELASARRPDDRLARDRCPDDGQREGVSDAGPPAGMTRLGSTWSRAPQTEGCAEPNRQGVSVCPFVAATRASNSPR